MPSCLGRKFTSKDLRAYVVGRGLLLFFFSPLLVLVLFFAFSEFFFFLWNSSRKSHTLTLLLKEVLLFQSSIVNSQGSLRLVNLGHMSISTDFCGKTWQWLMAPQEGGEEAQDPRGDKLNMLMKYVLVSPLLRIHSLLSRGLQHPWLYHRYWAENTPHWNFTLGYALNSMRWKGRAN